MEGHLMTRAPEVGIGATLNYPQDSYGYVVVDVSKTGQVVTLDALERPTKSTGHVPEYHTGGFPVWNHEYTPVELVSMRTGRRIRVHRHSNGRYYSGRAPITFNGARYYRDLSH